MKDELWDELMRKVDEYDEKFETHVGIGCPPIGLYYDEETTIKMLDECIKTGKRFKTPDFPKDVLI